MKVRKLWSCVIKTVKDIFISELQITENHKKLDVSENSKG